jgi:hypothetical protein
MSAATSDDERGGTMAKARDGGDEVDEKAEKIASWFGLFSAVAGLLTKADKLDATGGNAVCVIMFIYVLDYVLHDLYDALTEDYVLGQWYASNWWAILLSLSAAALVALAAWFAGYWLQRTLGPLHPGPVLGPASAYWLIFPSATYVFLYSLYDLWDAYHFEYTGWEYTVRTAIVSMVVVVVLGFMSYPAGAGPAVTP